MFSRIATLVPIAALAVVAAAAPNALEARTGYTCNSGSVYCCNTKSIASGTYSGGLLGGLLGILGIINLNLGNLNVDCSPIGILNNGGQCTQQAVCCTNDNSVSLINLSCTPISLNL